MVRKISTILLSLLMVWYAAVQASGEKTQQQELSGIRVFAQGQAQGETGEEIYGQIRVTAALRDLSADKTVKVRFILEGENEILTREVVITPESWDENDLLSACAVFMDLNSGVYTLRIGGTENAELDYILAEDGDESSYLIEGDTISFELSDSARLGSAWFILEETTGGSV